MFKIKVKIIDNYTRILYNLWVLKTIIQFMGTEQILYIYGY